LFHDISQLVKLDIGSAPKTSQALSKVQEGAAYLPCQEITGFASEEANMIVLPSCSLCKGSQIDNPVDPCERDLGFGLKAWANIYCTDQPATGILSHISNSTAPPPWRTPMMRWRRVKRSHPMVRRSIHAEDRESGGISKLGEITIL
jgi:hypothetical protein